MQPMQQHSDFMSAEKMQLFMAGLSGLGPEEVRKAKILYIRNALAEYRAMKESFAAFGCAQGCFMIIPIFWPILLSQKKMLNAQMSLARERIRNAIDVWRDDLRGERFSLDGEEIVPWTNPESGWRWLGLQAQGRCRLRSCRTDFQSSCKKVSPATVPFWTVPEKRNQQDFKRKQLLRLRSFINPGKIEESLLPEE